MNLNAKTKTINSKQKGSRGERELVHELNKYGFETRRTQQYAGGTEEAMDVIGLPYIHIECKRTERLNFYDAIEQAKRDNGDRDLFPIVFHKKNRKQWIIAMDLDRFMEIYMVYLNHCGRGNEDT